MNSAEQTVKLNLGHKRQCRERIGNTVSRWLLPPRGATTLPKMKRRPEGLRSILDAAFSKLLWKARSLFAPG